MTDNPLNFAELAGVRSPADEEWFNPTLILDTPLCIDPFLLSDLEEKDDFEGAHDEVVAFFNRQFEILASSGGARAGSATRRVQNNLRLPEVQELCLGYGRYGTAGSGSGTKLAKAMTGAMLFAIGAGLQHVNHFEEFGILQAGIGPDRISDATGNIIKWRLARYTETVCRALSVSTKRIVLDHARFDIASDRWMTVTANLPVHPTSKRPILLVPKRFLRHLPTLSSDEFKEFVWRKYREAHKDDLNKKVLTAVDKEYLLRLARRNEATRGEFIQRATNMGSHPYDFDGDPWGLISWEEPAKQYVNATPFKSKIPTDNKTFQLFIRDLVAYFKHFIEQQKGWQLLWDDRGRPRREIAAQRAFLGIVWLTCREHDISVSPEANVGRGPVDFKFSRGFHQTALVETKLASNTRWLHGITEQLPTYLHAEQVRNGIYVLIRHDDRFDRDISKLEQAASKIRKDRKVLIDVSVVDANRDQPSASRA